ncbi:glycoside hydrolase family 16 protein [Mucidula mucida]|nr:glycoside hydrolase family 16 protein [Mucidula mucida]
MTMTFASFTLALAACGLVSAATTYDMIKEYRDRDSLMIGRFTTTVDNTSTVAFNDKRSTVRIHSNQAYSVGSLWVADMHHVPYGCSVWPAWWSQAHNWPTGGEIDTFEGVNQVTMNQMALHTTSGCNQVNPTQSSTLVNSTNCDHDVDSNAGCVVTNPSTSSYGAQFAENGGGVFVTEYADSGISIWFFPRANVPSSISSTANSLSTDDLGTPVANWPNGGCNIQDHFQAQTLIFDITLCGDFAGSPSVFAQTCSGSCYNDYVVGNGSNYANAYFDVDYVRVFSKSGTNTASGASGLDLTWSLRALGALSAVVSWLVL